MPRVNNTTADSWDELTTEQQKELLASFSTELEDCIEQVLYWLETKKIILTGEQDKMGHYDYKDLRTEEEERKSKLWVTVSEDKEIGFQLLRPHFGTSKPRKNGENFGNEYLRRTKKNAI